MIIQEGKVQVIVEDGWLAYLSGMAIDLDGDPEGYHLDGSPPGHDYLANAGGPGNWYGVATDTGRKDGTPVRQGEGDPAPGFLVSLTAFPADPGRPERDQRRHVNAQVEPYMSIPGDLIGIVHKGDLGYVASLAKQRATATVVCDVGPRRKPGECSPATARALGIPDGKRGGCESGIATLVFLGSSKPWPRPDWMTEAAQLLDAWGGLDRLLAARFSSP